MKINAISADFATQKSRNVKKINSSNPTEQTAEKNGMSMISFRSGNPRHIAHFVAEEPLFGMAGGGVGTVSNDYNFLDKDIDKIAKIIPLYNQEVKYKEDLGLDTLPQLQYDILCSCSRYVKAGGMLVYSTCTLNPAENEENVKRFLTEHSNFQPLKIELKDDIINVIGVTENTVTLAPDKNGSDGFFISLFVRK